MKTKNINTFIFILIGFSFFTGCSRDSSANRSLSGYRTAEITRADIVRTVEATGRITPRNSSYGIPVGAQVNGKLIKLFVDYNSVVTNGQVVALIDPLVYDANYKSSLAQLHVAEANVNVRRAAVKSSEAELLLAQKTHARKAALVEKNLASVAELDSAIETLTRAEANLESARASLVSAEASVEQARAASEKAKTDLGYCTIVSPVDGVVIDRKVEEGETVVSSMNAVPVLTIAEDLKTIWIEATIPEADIGNVQVGQRVTFTADAYRQKFVGIVKQIRKAATELNNVVTFPVIIEAENHGEMLFPGMTATLSIETACVNDAVATMSAAFRFRPKDEDISRITDEVPRGRKIWLLPQRATDPLDFVLVSEGVSDDYVTEISCENSEALIGRQAVIGYAVSNTAVAPSEVKNPFMPQPPTRNSNKGTAPEPKK